MPRYYFHSLDGSVETDPNGIDLSSESEARTMAMRYAGEVLQSQPGNVWEKGQWRVQVSDEDHTPLFTILTIVVDAINRPSPKLAYASPALRVVP